MTGCERLNYNVNVRCVYIFSQNVISYKIRYVGFAIDEVVRLFLYPQDIVRTFGGCTKNCTFRVGGREIRSSPVRCYSPLSYVYYSHCCFLSWLTLLALETSSTAN